MDAARLNFVTPIANIRPRGSHRYDVWSPKIRRRVTIFGELKLLTWIMLESMPEVLSFCERPYQTVIAGSNVLFDYWVKRANFDELVITGSDQKANRLNLKIENEKSLLQWADQNLCKIRISSESEIKRNHILLINWKAILHYLSANHTDIKAGLLETTYNLISNGGDVSFTNLYRNITNQDPILVRTAVFLLLHQGRVICPSISTNEISDDTTFEVT